MSILGILLLGFLGILILVFGFLAYEIWSVLQIYRSVTDVANIRNLKKIQKISLWIIKWCKSRKSAPMVLLLATVFVSCHAGLTPGITTENDPIIKRPDPNVLNMDGKAMYWSACFLHN